MRTIILMLMAAVMTGAFCQKIVFDSFTFISACTSGARIGIDEYRITGTMKENMLLQQKWQTAVFIKKLNRTSSQFNSICQLTIKGAECIPSSAFKCGCFYNTTTDQATFTVIGPVHTDDQGGIIYAEWQHDNGTIYSDKNYTFQDIYDVNAGHLMLTIAGVAGNLPSGSCTFRLTLNKSNNLVLCCSNTAKPCYPQISFNGAVVTNNTETCVTYPTSQLASDGVMGHLVLSYSVCDLTDYRQGSSCTVTPIPVVPENDKWKVILPAVIVSVAVVIIIGAGIAVWCCKKKKRSKAVSNHGTNENADKAHTSGHPKKDRQYPEHTNQIYDAGQSSPSEDPFGEVKTTTHDNFLKYNTDQEKNCNKPTNGSTDGDECLKLLRQQLSNQQQAPKL